MIYLEIINDEIDNELDNLFTENECIEMDIEFEKQLKETETYIQDIRQRIASFNID